MVDAVVAGHREVQRPVVVADGRGGLTDALDGPWHRHALVLQRGTDVHEAVAARGRDAHDGRERRRRVHVLHPGGGHVDAQRERKRCVSGDVDGRVGSPVRAHVGGTIGRGIDHRGVGHGDVLRVDIDGRHVGGRGIAERRVGEAAYDHRVAHAPAHEHERDDATPHREASCIARTCDE